MLTITKFDAVLLFTVVADMVLKPSASDWPVLVVFAVVIVGAALLFLRPAMRKSVAAA
jgi:hypothetical protein